MFVVNIEIKKGRKIALIDPTSTYEKHALSGISKLENNILICNNYFTNI